MKIEFKKHKGDPNKFFKILPQDWQEALFPVWTKYSKDAAIYVLIEEGEIIAGGIVFKGLTDEMHSFKEEAMLYVNSGYYYIGYLWVIESRRGEDFGSLWLKSIKENDPKANLWLTIEEEKLKKFYLKNGFQLVKESKDREVIEWLFVFKTDEN